MEQQTNQDAVAQKPEKKKRKWWYPGKGYQGESRKKGWEISTYYKKFLQSGVSIE